MDMTNAEKNLTEDRLSRESDVQAHEGRFRVGATPSVSSLFPLLLFIAYRLWRRDILVRSLHTQMLSRSSRISSDVCTIFKCPNATTERRRRLHKLNWLPLKAVGTSKGKHLTERLLISLRGIIIRIFLLTPVISDNLCESLRCKALTEQNNVLHQHLDNVSSQAARIRQAADSSVATPGEGETPDDGAETKLSELRAVINYLRKEKEIVDMQLELCKQENARLKTQIGHLARDLEDTRTTLSEVSLSPIRLCMISFFLRRESVLPPWPPQTRNMQNWSKRFSN